MRLKKHLNERFENVSKYIAAKEDKSFYSERSSVVLSPFDIFNNNNPTSLEIGCGKGAFAFNYAQLHPNINLIAVDMISNVIIDAVEMVADEGLINVKFMVIAAENLLAHLEEHTISEIILNFPCPYKKNSYSNARLTHPRFLEIYKKLLLPQGKIILTTDKDNFFEFSVNRLREEGFFITELTTDLPRNEKLETEYEKNFRDMGIPIKRVVAYFDGLSTSKQ
ncbi:MAG: tRNA (guanosine(46)-N7)-methyltransferase TrmB [Clostridia bacterium]|nr:tRNA (guanosine(46)-N7)-methyltransferase TrmB [Clostridia bacterium]